MNREFEEYIMNISDGGKDEPAMEKENNTFDKNERDSAERVFNAVSNMIENENSSETDASSNDTRKNVVSINDIPKKKKSRKSMRRAIASAVAACLVLGICVYQAPPFKAGEGGIVPRTVGIGDYSVYAASDYGEIYDRISASFKEEQAVVMNAVASGTGTYKYAADDAAVEEAAEPESSYAEPTSPAGSDEMPELYADAPADPDNAGEAQKESGSDSYSKTNTQVADIDEDDIVKTDGENIYVLRDNGELAIVSASGSDSSLLSKTKVWDPDENTDKNVSKYTYGTGIYVNGKTLIVLTTENVSENGTDPLAKTEAAEDILYNTWRSRTMSYASFYDITDPSSPELVAKKGQDGSILDTRMAGDTVYMVTNYYVDPYTKAPAKYETEKYVPCCYDGEERTVMDAGCVNIVNETESTSYSVICTYDASDGTMKDKLSVLGAGNELYMSLNNLYITDTRYETDESEPYTESVYTVKDYTEKRTTNIMRIPLDGALRVEAAATVEGGLLNQFSMDEYEGNLRLVTTVYDYSYKIYEDKEHGFTNWADGDSKETNSLFVLNSDLSVIGSITGLAEDERVYSVRFSGDTGYFVTFRETDPLFAVDLSDPASPEILSALKIPGFSNYLHNYSYGRLFGLGMDADEKTGATKGMKLSMFDTEDPADVTEITTMKVDADSSAAQYDHKAILISKERDMIAFPAEKWYASTAKGDVGGGTKYLVYGYSDEKGFYERGSFDLGSEFTSYNVRGLYAGDYIYIAGNNAVLAVTQDGFIEAARVSLT